MENKSIPRGIRNNNPLNIIHGRSRWQGMAKEQTDRRFVQFVSMEYGIRAAFKNLQSYSRLPNPCITLRQYITRWCPPIEQGNDTRRYIEFVSKITAVMPNRPLMPPRYAKFTWCRIVSAMIRMECGRTVPMSVIEKGYEMAFGLNK